MDKSEKRKKHHKSKESKDCNETEDSLIEQLKTRITLGSEEVFNDFPVDPLQDKWSLEKFREKFQVKVVNVEEDKKGHINSMEFDMIGLDSSLANAFRRIMLAEVPSMAVDKVLIYNNTTVIPDEVLAHRLGMIPFKADPRLFEMPTQPQYSDVRKTTDDEVGLQVDPRTTLVFKLCVRCKKNPKYKGSSTDHNLDEMYIDHNVYSRHIEWVNDPKKSVSGGDVDFWSQFTSEEVGPIDGEILIAKLRPGQEIDIEMHCVKGVGKDHAKFQPVATAWYRLLPEIVIKKPIVGEKAHRFKKCFPEGVIKIEKVDGQDVARVSNARLDKASREVLRHDDLKDLVELRRVKDHFIYTVESVGALPSNAIVTEAVDILMQKCQVIMDEIGRPGSH